MPDNKTKCVMYARVHLKVDDSNCQPVESFQLRKLNGNSSAFDLNSAKKRTTEFIVLLKKIECFFYQKP